MIHQLVSQNRRKSDSILTDRKGIGRRKYKRRKHTPSEARTMNWSLSVSVRCENSGIEITPYSFKQKSPNARAIARPGASSNGNQTLGTSGSSCNAKTLPLHRLILSASPAAIRFQINYWVCKDEYNIKIHTNYSANDLLGKSGFRSTVNWTATMESLLSLDPMIARESPIYPMNRFDPFKFTNKRIR